MFFGHSISIILFFYFKSLICINKSIKSFPKFFTFSVFVRLQVAMAKRINVKYIQFLQDKGSIESFFYMQRSINAYVSHWISLQHKGVRVSRSKLDSVNWPISRFGGQIRKFKKNESFWKINLTRLIEHFLKKKQKFVE